MQWFEFVFISIFNHLYNFISCSSLHSSLPSLPHPWSLSTLSYFPFPKRIRYSHSPMPFMLLHLFGNPFPHLSHPRPDTLPISQLVLGRSFMKPSTSACDASLQLPAWTSLPLGWICVTPITVSRESLMSPLAPALNTFEKETKLYFPLFLQSQAQSFSPLIKENETLHKSTYLSPFHYKQACRFLFL